MCLAWGASGRRFKSGRPDHASVALLYHLFFPKGSALPQKEDVGSEATY